MATFRDSPSNRAQQEGSSVESDPEMDSPAAFNPSSYESSDVESNDSEEDSDYGMRVAMEELQSAQLEAGSSGKDPNLALPPEVLSPTSQSVSGQSGYGRTMTQIGGTQTGMTKIGAGLPPLGGIASGNIPSSSIPSSVPTSVRQNSAILRPPVLVVCPGCETPFSVSRAAVAGFSRPNFHCSKCDLVFAVSADELQEMPAPSIPPAAIPAPVSAAIPSTISSVATPATGAPGSVANLAATRRVSQLKVEQISSPTPPSSAASTSYMQARPLQTTFNFGAGGETQRGSIVTADALTHGQSLQAQSSQAKGSQMNNLGQNLESGRLMVAGVGEVKIAPLADTHSGSVTEESLATRSYRSPSDSGLTHPSSLSPNSGSRSLFSFIKGFSRIWGKSSEPRSTELHTQTAQAWVPPRSSTQARPFKVNRLSPYTITVPIIAGLVILGAVAVAAIQVESVRHWLATAWAPREATTVVNSLILRNVRYSTVTLENGDQFALIVGAVYNGSGAGIEGATVEGALFGSRGDELAQARAQLGNRLSRAKIESLTSDMIHTFQSERRTRTVVVRPGESHPFVVAIALEGPARNAASFSARVVSAR